VLLAERPSRAERLTLDVPEIREIVERGHGVVRWFDPAEPAYISVRDGVRTTSETIPSWADPSEVIQMAAPSPPGSDLLERLERLEEAVRDADPDRHATYRMADTLAAVRQRHRDELPADAATCAVLAADHAFLDARADLPFDLGEFRELVSKVLREYLDLRMSGNGTRRILALHGMVEVAGLLLDDAMELARERLRRLVDEADGDLPAARLLLPVHDVQSWIDAFDAVTEGRAWILAASAGRLCLSRADSHRDTARGELTFEQFHRALYMALVYYRAASLCFDVVVNAGPGRVRAPALEEALDRSRTCEEMRARIEVSLGWAVDLNPMGYNLSFPERLDPWIRWLLRNSPGTAVAEVHNLGSQLGMPDFVRDLALASIDLHRGRLERAVDRTRRVVERMEAHLYLVAEWGLGYFAYAVALTAAGLRALGRGGEAKEVEQRLRPDWLRDRLSAEDQPLRQ
jgi:hypothetical protein